jgi:hypothetical protein
MSLGRMGFLAGVVYRFSPAIETFGGPFAPQAEHRRLCRNVVGRIHSPAFCTMAACGHVTR